jgi:hypothetical protein
MVRKTMSREQTEQEELFKIVSDCFLHIWTYGVNDDAIYVYDHVFRQPSLKVHAGARINPDIQWRIVPRTSIIT